MMFRSANTFNFSSTPFLLKYIIVVSLFLTLSSAIIDPFLAYYGIFSIKQLLAISREGISSYLFWQPFTYSFLQPYQGMHLSVLLHLAFQMYTLWMFGTSIIERFGNSAFLRLYFLTSVMSGIVAATVLLFTGSSAFILGCTPVLLSLFTVWTMLHTDSQLFLFLLFPIKTKWLFAGLVGGMFLILLAEGDVLSLSQNAVGILCGYLYATIGWQLQTPYSFTHSLDIALADFGLYLRANWEQGRYNAKVIDIRTGESLNKDDAFVDAMLSKISMNGEHSLTWFEKRKLNKISRNKRF